ncbi:MAG TPA: magnesium transporter CorA family protein [Vicinamibacterales bacterium]|nr:magnesium transporter CorA family protein [Vicinamibacterales bacterium]
MISILLQRKNVTERVPALEPQWLRPGSDVVVWVDLAAPTPEEFRILSETFHFHPLAVEDAVADVPHPKIEPYDGYVYLILHGIDFRAAQHRFATHDTDFFLGPTYLVTVHDGQTRTIKEMHEICQRNGHILSEGPVALMHRIIDLMVDHYRPEVDKLESRLDTLEDCVFDQAGGNMVRDILTLKRDVNSLRRVVQPQRDVIGRLARREFAFISDELAYRFRDVFDHLVRLSDEALLLQDRVTSILDAHLSNVSNRLNQQMKLLTLVTVIALPFTVLGGLFGMNVHLPGISSEDDPRAFWWILAVAIGLVGLTLTFLRGKRSL